MAKTLATGKRLLNNNQAPIKSTIYEKILQDRSRSREKSANMNFRSNSPPVIFKTTATLKTPQKNQINLLLNQRRVSAPQVKPKAKQSTKEKESNENQ